METSGGRPTPSSSSNQTLAADGTVAAHVTSQTATDPWAKAGVMLRATSDPGSPYYAAFVTPGNGVAVQWRTAQGGTFIAGGDDRDGSHLPADRPLHVRGTVYYTAYTSPNGTTWTAVPGSTQTVAGLTGTLLAGLAVTSHDQGTSSTVGFDTVSVTATELPPPGYGCPTGWTCSDIGDPLPLGQQTLTGGLWSLLGGGGDIWAMGDSFHFVSQALAADGSISAHVTSQTATDPWAKAGVMLRATTDPGLALLCGLRDARQRSGRPVADGPGRNNGPGPEHRHRPHLPEVARTGTSFTAYTSPDGSTWTAVPGSTVSLTNLSGPILRGLAVTSHNQGTGSTVSMDTVTIVGSMSFLCRPLR